LIRALPALLALALLVTAEPWAVPGFTLVYSYHVKASGLLSLRGKEVNGTITYVYLNTTGNTIYVNMTVNANVTLPNGKIKVFKSSTIMKFRDDASLIFLTNKTLEGLRGQMRCEDGYCTLNVSTEQALNTGAKVVLNATSKFDLKYMVMVESHSVLKMASLHGKRALGTMTTEMRLVKIVPPSTGNVR